MLLAQSSRISGSSDLPITATATFVVQVYCAVTALLFLLDRSLFFPPLTFYFTVRDIGILPVCF